MPRLLSNKSPNKKSSVKVEEKKFEIPTPNNKKKSLWPEENMTAWEYYNHLMKSGKRKMVYHEWVVWKMKKDEEDLEKGKCIKEPPFKRLMSSEEYNWRLKKDPLFDDPVARGGFALDFKKNGGWC